MMKLTGKWWVAAAILAAVAGVATTAQRSEAQEQQTKPRRPRAQAVQPPKASVTADSPLEAGKYLVMITGCNDCHTANFAAKNGKVAETEWLKGDVVGYKGPWGTTYAANLRLTVDLITEDGWVQLMKVRNARPPMPWTILHAMSEQDLRAMYQYIKSLPGEKGEKAPDYVPPGAEPKGPVVVFPEPPAE